MIPTRWRCRQVSLRQGGFPEYRLAGAQSDSPGVPGRERRHSQGERFDHTLHMCDEPVSEL